MTDIPLPTDPPSILEVDPRRRRADNCPFEAVGPFLVVEVEKEPEQVGMIHIPEKSRDILTVGTVVAVGEDVRYLRVGDRVPFERHTGTDREWEGRIYRLTIQDELPVRLAKGNA